MIHHELYDDSSVFAEVLQADHPHDVGSVLRVGLLAELVGENQTSRGLKKRILVFYFVINHGWFFVNFVTVQGFFEMNQPLQNKNMLKSFYFINLHFKLV